MSQKNNHNNLIPNSSFEEVYNYIAPTNPTLMEAIKQFVCGRGRNDTLKIVMVESMRLDARKKDALIGMTIRLAELNQLSDERFNTLMLAIMS